MFDNNNETVIISERTAGAHTQGRAQSFRTRNTNHNFHCAISQSLRQIHIRIQKYTT